MTDLRARIEELEEENRQLRALLDKPETTYRGLERTPAAELWVLRWLMTGGVWPVSRLLDTFRLRKWDHCAGPKTISVHICRLRKWLGALDPPVVIFTQWGVGYWMDEANRALLNERAL